MNARMSPSANTVEKEPERADGRDETPRGTGSSGSRGEFQTRFQSQQSSNDPELASPRESFVEPDPVERSIKIYSYMGSLPDKVGQIGDFYIDEMTNMLYGPKTESGWPEEGESAAGLCKRTWIGMTRTRLTPVPPESRFMKAFWSLLRILLPIRLVKSLISL